MSLFFMKFRGVEVGSHEVTKASIQGTAGRWSLSGQVSKMFVTETVVTKFAAHLTFVAGCQECLAVVAIVVTVVACAAVVVHRGCRDVFAGVVVSCDVSDIIVDPGPRFGSILSVAREVVATDEIWTRAESIAGVWHAVVSVLVLMRARGGIGT